MNEYGWIPLLLGALIVAGMLGVQSFQYLSPTSYESVTTKLTSRAVGVTRNDIIDCMLAYVDGCRHTKDSRGRSIYFVDTAKQDGCIDVSEIDCAKNYYLSSFEQKVAWVKPNDKIMKDCDFDMAQEDASGRPRCIDREDMLKSNQTCLNTPDKLSKMETYICRRAAAKAA